MKRKHNLILYLYQKSSCVQVKVIICKGLVVGAEMIKVKLYLYHTSVIPEQLWQQKDPDKANRRYVESKFKCM